MITFSSRQTLESHLLRHQQAGDLAAQAETLMALAALAWEDESNSLAQALYGQAYTAYEQVGDRQGMVRAMRGIGDVLRQRSLDQLVDVDLWNEMVLTHALEVGDRQTQARTYLAMRNQRTDTLAASIIAYACYHALGDVPPDVRTPHILSETFRFTPNRNIAFRETELARFRALGDTRGEAHILLAFADTALWAKDYHRARADFESAQLLFQALHDQEQLKYVLLRMMRMARRIRDYDLYKACHAQVMQCFSPQTPTEDALVLWMELAFVTAERGELAEARAAYQKAIAYTVLLNEPERQGRLYWQWGQMEYQHKRYTMGQALCQWSIALVEIYDPDQVSNYRRELKQMTQEATR